MLYQVIDRVHGTGHVEASSFAAAENLWTEAKETKGKDACDIESLLVIDAEEVIREDDEE